MTEVQIAFVMRAQLKMWEGNEAAIEALDDTCHHFANVLGINKKAERMAFFELGGSTFYTANA